MVILFCENAFLTFREQLSSGHLAVGYYTVTCNNSWWLITLREIRIGNKWTMNVDLINDTTLSLSLPLSQPGSNVWRVAVFVGSKHQSYLPIFHWSSPGQCQPAVAVQQGGRRRWYRNSDIRYYLQFMRIPLYIQAQRVMLYTWWWRQNTFR